VTAFLGDGGFMASLNALDTVASLKLPMAIIVMDDGGFGAERRIFARTGDDPYTADYVTPDLKAVAEALGVKGYKATSSTDVKRILERHDFQQAMLLHVVIDFDSPPTEMEFSGWA
jgi:acetolactate synthase-1/2/3 large subunit